LLVKEEINMSGIESSNQGPGWHDHDTPYGTIHSYDGDNHSSYGGPSGGNSHEGISDKTHINISSTRSYDGFYMTMCVNNLKSHEGFKNTMYKDSEGNITVGIGHLLSTPDMAASLPFSRTHTWHAHGDDMEKEVSASKEEITEAFNNFKKDSRQVPMNLHLSNNAVIGLCISDVQVTEKGLRSLYSGYDGFSNSRKTALVDMGFNLGIPKLSKDFPNFNAAVNRGDWETAAQESHRNLHQRGDQRNKDTAAQLRDKR
jgi:GH24 family phage-related lysozyme (muramidase)